jgi:hypothetical protein
VHSQPHATHGSSRQIAPYAEQEILAACVLRPGLIAANAWVATLTTQAFAAREAVASRLALS